MAPRLRSISQRGGITGEDYSRSSSSSVASVQEADNDLKQQLDTRPLFYQNNVSSGTRLADNTTTSSSNERDRENHDYFNLIALLPVIITTAINWDFLALFQGIPLEIAYVGNYFYSNWAATLIYFTLDLAWVAIVPTCVKSPDVIIKHHIVAIIYLQCGIWFRESVPGIGWIMGAILSVELNTWFLILRRVSFKRSDIIPSFLGKIINFLFYATWIIVRIYVYPYIWVKFVWIAVDDYIRNGLTWHNEFLVLCVHTFLVILNLKWSYDLFLPFFVKSSPSNKKIVAEGL